jgi:uncharacterized protein YndB with AHSA1/START domain
VATARKARVLAATPERVWEVVSDPHHLPRWWPGVSRMEGVSEDRFTEVFFTKKGRPVRVDFRVLESEAHEDGAGRRRWEQEVVGTPFERLLHEAVTEIRLEPADAGTRVEIVLKQTMRGYSRLGGIALRRVSGGKLVEALDGLERIC